MTVVDPWLGKVYEGRYGEVVRESTQGPDHELQPGEPALDLLETCDGPGGPPWDHPWLDAISDWRHRHRRGLRLLWLTTASLLAVVAFTVALTALAMCQAGQLPS
jgi:hypothetical protein